MRHIAQTQHPLLTQLLVIELVTVADLIAPSVRRVVDRAVAHGNVTDRLTAQTAHGGIVIAGDVRDKDPIAAHPQNLLQHRRVTGRPIDPLSQRLQIDDVADQIEALAAHGLQKVEQIFRLAIRRA